jgi:restriction endonuclease S subunit
LEGLEVSEIALSEAYLANDDFRFDSEFYSQDNLKKQDAVKKHIYKPLSCLCSLIAGPFGSAITSENYDPDSTCRYIRAKDIKSFFIDNTDPVFIKHNTFDAFPQFHLQENDILLTVVGMNFGKAAIIYKEDCPAVFSCKSTLIRNPSVNAWYLLAYLSSSVGHGLVRRGQRGAAQPGINLLDIENVLVPIFSNDFQLSIETFVRRSRSLILASHVALQNAETLLLDTLGMADFSPSSAGINIQSFRNSFAATGRLDAEYYQPKYEQMVSKISTRDHTRLVNLVSIQKSIEPGSDAYSDDESGLPFLRVADYNKYGITEPQKRLSTAFVAENRNGLDALKPKKNTILFSKDGSVGEAYCLREDADFITSGAVLHLTVYDAEVMLPEYLTLVLNSKLVKMQAERDAGGSVILHWRVGEIENVVVPLVDMPTQSDIADLVQQSFTLKAESERLLEVAKRAVEIAIEQDENAGMVYIEANS